MSVVKKRRVMIVPANDSIRTREIIVEVDEDGSESPRVIKGSIGVEILWGPTTGEMLVGDWIRRTAGSLVIPWAAIFSISDEPVNLGYVLNGRTIES